MTRGYSKTAFVAPALWLILAGLSAAANDARSAEEIPASVARGILNRHQDSVVWISAVTKLSFSSGDSSPLPVNIPDREQKFEANGAVLERDGLTVTALSALDPTKEISGREINTSSGRITLEATAILKEVRIILADGTEVPADVVMKDADLDLAFIRPRADAKEAEGVSFKPLDLKSDSKGDIADDAITVSRMDEVLNRQPAVYRGQIVGVTSKPRRFLRATGATIGCPAFAADGKVLGIGVNRSLKDKQSVTVLLPASDVLEIADQARTAKPIRPAESPTKEDQS